MLPIYVYDPTAKDALSKVRGIGRYLQLLHETLQDSVTFTSDLRTIPYQSIFLNPFFDFIKQPLSFNRIAKKQVAVIHDIIRLKYPNHFPAGLKGNVYSIVNKIAFDYYDNIITDSIHCKNDIIEVLNVPESKVQVIYLPLPSLYTSTHQSYPAQSSLPKDYILYVGDVTWNKNIVNLAEAIRHTDIHCVFVGKSFLNHTELEHREKSDFKKFISLTKDNKNFIFPGYVDDTSLLSMYQHARFNILVSRDEGFGLSFLEAASQRIPSILSDIEIFHETAQDTALFVDPHNPKDIAEKMEYLFHNEPLRQELGKKAYHRSLFFSQNQFKKDLLAVLK